VAPAGDAAVVEVLDDPEALGVDDPQAAAMRPTTATPATAVMDRVARRRSAGRACVWALASLIIGRTSLRGELPAPRSSASLT
jgi:hypothetical protein